MSTLFAVVGSCGVEDAFSWVAAVSVSRERAEDRAAALNVWCAANGVAGWHTRQHIDCPLDPNMHLSGETGTNYEVMEVLSLDP